MSTPAVQGLWRVRWRDSYWPADLHTLHFPRKTDAEARADWIERSGGEIVSVDYIEPEVPHA